MPTAAHHSRIVVVDSSVPGPNLPHSMYSIVYVPSWLLMREKFNWSNMPRTLGMMKEYFVTAPHLERPIRAQRCLYSLKAIDLYHPGRYPEDDRYYFETLYKQVNYYLLENPVVAWDWIVSWTECRLLAQVTPEDLVRLFRQLRSKRDTKKMPKPELAYFLNIISEVCLEYHIDTERK